MEMTARKFASFEELKDEEYRYWQSVSPEERIAAAWDISLQQYSIKGVRPDGRGLKTTLVRFERT